MPVSVGGWKGSRSGGRERTGWRTPGLWRRLRLIPLVAPLAVLAGCDAAPRADSLEQAQARALRVGFAIEPPYAFVDSAGEPTGEAPVILRGVAAEAGIDRLQWFPFQFHDLIPALRAGRIDVVAAGLMITEERQRLVRFSLPTACVGPVIIGRRRARGEASKLPAHGSGVEVRTAVLEGSVEQRALQQRPAPGYVPVPVPDLATAVAALKAGNVDALAITAPTAREVISREPGLVIRERALPPGLERTAGCTAFAFRHEDVALAAAFDSALTRFVASPEHRRAVLPFGFTESELLAADSVTARLPARPTEE